MRKLLIVAVALLLTVPAFAGDATMAGTWTVGGNVNSAGGAGTSLGYFYMDNIEIGGGFGYGSTDDGNGTTTSNMGLAIGGNYFLSQMGPGVPYGHAGFSYRSFDNGTTTGSGMYLDLGVGYDMHLTENVAWDIDFIYHMGMGDYDDSGMALGVGLKAFIF